MPWSSRANYGSLENGEGDQCQMDSHDSKRYLYCLQCQKACLLSIFLEDSDDSGSCVACFFKRAIEIPKNRIIIALFVLLYDILTILILIFIVYALTLMVPKVMHYDR